MSTICFDIRRADDQHVCIKYGDLNHFDLPKHLPFAYWNQDKPYPERRGKRYVYAVVVRDLDYDGIERILFATNSKMALTNFLREYTHPIRGFLSFALKRPRYLMGWFRYGRARCLKNRRKYRHPRVLKLPLWDIKKEKFNFPDGRSFYGTTSKPHDMGDEFKLYCPVDLNKKHKVYGTYRHIGQTKTWYGSHDNYEWVPPKGVNEE